MNFFGGWEGGIEQWIPSSFVRYLCFMNGDWVTIKQNMHRNQFTINAIEMKIGILFLSILRRGKNQNTYSKQNWNHVFFTNIIFETPDMPNSDYLTQTNIIFLFQMKHNRMIKRNYCVSISSSSIKIQHCFYLFYNTAYREICLCFFIISVLIVCEQKFKLFEFRFIYKQFCSKTVFIIYSVLIKIQKRAKSFGSI